MSLHPPRSASGPARETRRSSLAQSTTLPSAKHEVDQLNATASGLLGLSFSPIPTTSPLAPTPAAGARAAPPTRPVAIPTRKSGRRGSEAGAGGSVGASGSLGSSLSGMDKKKSGGGGAGASLKRETLGTRTSSRTSVPPKLFDHRTNSDSSTPPPFSFSSSPATPASSLLSPQSLPAHVSILASGNPDDDGEILEDEMKDLKNGKGGKRRSASVFRCESCSKIYRHPSCLVKHRWQHSPHWEQSSKLLLSKHQQVQVLEAATILVHLAPNSLPEDKSLWPAAVSPASHPMPSISFMDSRQRSKATSTHASNLLRQQSILSPAAIAAPELTNNTNTRTTASSRSSEEVMSSASSPDSSAEDSDDDDILEDDNDEELEKADSGYGRSYNNVKQEQTSANMAVPPPAMGERRTSFGTATALMGRMGLGSLPLRSPVSGQDASLASTSPYGASSLSVGVPVVNYSTSPSGYHHSHGTPSGTSPHLPMPSSSLRGGAVHEEDEEEEEDGDEDEEMERSQKEGSKGSEEEGDWNTMDMEM